MRAFKVEQIPGHGEHHSLIHRGYKGYKLIVVISVTSASSYYIAVVSKWAETTHQTLPKKKKKSLMQECGDRQMPSAVALPAEPRSAANNRIVRS